MQNKTENILTHTMRTGLILGIVLIVSEFCFLLVPVSEGEVLSNALLLLGMSLGGFIAQIFCIFHFTRKFKEDVVGDDMSYMVAFRYGFYMFLFAGLVFAACVYFSCQFLEVNYILGKGNCMIWLMEHSEYSQKMITEYREALEVIKGASAARLAWDSLSSMVFTGILVLLFTSIFFRNKKNI